MSALAKERYLAARQRVDDMIAGRIPCRLPAEVLRRRALQLRTSPEYIQQVRRAEAELGGEDGLGILPFIILGVVGLGALAAWQGFSWAEEREKRLACEANPDDCGLSQYIPLVLLGVVGLGALSYAQTGRIPFLGSFGGGDRR